MNDVALRGFGQLGIAAMLVIFIAPNPLLKAALVLLWVWASNTPWRDIGFVKPKNWIASVAVGLVAGASLKIAMKALVMPLLGAPERNSTYQFLVGNPAALPAMLFIVIASAGFGEETFFRGYLFERLGKLMGSNTRAKAFIVIFTSTIFAAAHLPDQGRFGAEQALVTGLVFGTWFAITGRLFTIMCAHAAFDLVAVALIYWNIEPAVARLVFK
jgi:membrane protease YdiL (CAAX protease family)